MISIIGCGWLGLDLAQSLKKSGHTILGTTTSKEKLTLLNESEISSVLLNSNLNSATCSNMELLNQSKIIIINIPPKIKLSSRGEYTEKIKNIINLFENIKSKKILFISSTSVYGDLQGTVTEETKEEPSSESGMEILSCENYLQTLPLNDLTILRFGGLIDKTRHPANFLNNKTHLDRANAPVNLIHKDDCILVISRIIEKEIWNEKINAVCDEHQTRKLFYTKVCQLKNLTPPTFLDDTNKEYKIVSNEKLKDLLNYTFKFPDLINYY